MTLRLPALRPREVIRALERAGFSLHHVTGSHHYFRHPDRPALRVTVPVHAADLERGTLAAIIKQAASPPKSSSISSDRPEMYYPIVFVSCCRD